MGPPKRSVLKALKMSVLHVAFFILSWTPYTVMSTWWGSFFRREILIITLGTPLTAHLVTVTPERYKMIFNISNWVQQLEYNLILNHTLLRFQWLWTTSCTWRPSWTAASTRSSTEFTTFLRDVSVNTPAQTPGPWCTAAGVKTIELIWFFQTRQNTRRTDSCGRGVNSPNMTLTRTSDSPVVTTKIWNWASQPWSWTIFGNKLFWQIFLRNHINLCNFNCAVLCAGKKSHKYLKIKIKDGCNYKVHREAG